MTTPFVPPRDCPDRYSFTTTTRVGRLYGETPGEDEVVTAIISDHSDFPTCLPEGWDPEVLTFHPAVCPRGWTAYDLEFDTRYGYGFLARCCSRQVSPEDTYRPLRLFP